MPAMDCGMAPVSMWNIWLAFASPGPELLRQSTSYSGAAGQAEQPAPESTVWRNPEDPERCVFHYDALTVILRQRVFHQVAGQVSYTWSHDLDLSADSNGGGTLSQQFNPAADYGNANWDIRNRVVGVLTYSLPTFNASNLLCASFGRLGS